ncbi:MAG TPA: type II toxin-antitoxin system VapC family toxin [Gemmataceae bacterium]|nr:type II toxin-antitoxin system VapC family toxin [Gemmataceae bacterium]
MSLYLLDTDHVSLYQMGHPRIVQQILGHLQDQLAITVITVEEQLSGWQRSLRQARDNSRRAEVYRRMALAIEHLSGWSVIPFPLSALTRHADLLRQRLNVSSNDLKIAAIALEMSATVVTRNTRDFGRVAGLVYEDWSV